MSRLCSTCTCAPVLDYSSRTNSAREITFKRDNTVLSSLFLFVRRYSAGFMLATSVSRCFLIQWHGIFSYWGSLQWLLWAWSASKHPVLGGHSSTWTAFWPHWNAPHSKNWQQTQFTSELFKGFARKYGFNHIASKLAPNSLTNTSLFPHAQSRPVGQIRSKRWEDFPCRGRGQIVLFCYTIPKFASMALLSQQLLLKWSSQKEAWKLLLSGGTKPCLVLYV